MLETDLNKQDQYNRRNNLDIQGIHDSVPDDQLEEKVIEIFNQINVKINTFDIEDCHHSPSQPASEFDIFCKTLKNTCTKFSSLDHPL